MTSGDSSSRMYSGPWIAYALWALQAHAQAGRIILGPSRVASLVMPAPIPVVLLASRDDAEWALDAVELLLEEAV